MMKCKRLLIIYATIAFMGLMYMVAYLQVEHVEVEGWGYNTSRDPNIYIANRNLTAQILPEHFCDRDSFLTIMVFSSPKNFEQRLAIRQTWGEKMAILEKNVSLYFILGETTNEIVKADVINESETYLDVIQESFIDSYNNLTLKTIFMLKLASNHCVNSTKYLLKIDDDIYLNLEMLLTVLLIQGNNTTDLLMGRMICKAKPIVDIKSKWYSPSYMYNGLIYPDYLSGTAYVMSTGTAHKLYNTALQTPILHLEDVYTTGICAKKARVKPRNSPLFTFRVVKKDPCLMRKLCTIHQFTPGEMKEMYASLNGSTLSCGTKFDVNNWLFNNVLRTNRSFRQKECH